MAGCWSITTVYWLEILFDDNNARCIPTTFAIIVKVNSCLPNDYVFVHFTKQVFDSEILAFCAAM